jgi:hypothetical protein
VLGPLKERRRGKMLWQGKQFLPYAAGNKIYGGGSDAPNLGPVNPMGYRERDLKYQARRDAILRKMKATQSGNYGSSDVGRLV